MSISKIQLRIIAVGRALLQLWENMILKPQPLPIRAMTQFLSENNGQASTLVGVEIGVYLGVNAASILSALPCKKLFLIDPYLKYDDFKGDNWGNYTQATNSLIIELIGLIPKLHETRIRASDYYETISNYDEILRIAETRLKKFEHKIQFIRQKSSDAVDYI